MKVGPFVENIGCTVFVLMLVHAVAAKGAIAAIWIRLGKVSVTDRQSEPVVRKEH